MGGAAKYKLGSIGPLQVSRNPSPSWILTTRPLNLTSLGLAAINNPGWSRLLYPRDPKNRVALVVLHLDPNSHLRDRAERPAVRPLGLLIQRSWNSKRSHIAGLWPRSTIWTQKDMWRRYTPSNISIGTPRALRLKLSWLLTGAANVLMSGFIIPCQHFPITYSMNSPGLDRVVDKSPPNPTTWLSLEEMSGPSVQRPRFGWLLFCSSGLMKHPLQMASCLWGWTYLVSTLAEYVMSTINPTLPLGYKVMWDHIITCTPWMKKHLFNLTCEEEHQMCCQPILVVGISSDLEVAMEKCPGEEEGTPGEAGCQTFPVFQAIQTEEHGTRGNHKDPSKTTGPGPAWTHIPLKDKGPDVRKCYDPPQHRGWYRSGPSKWFSDKSKPTQPFTTNRGTSHSGRGCDNCPLLSGQCAGGPGDCMGCTEQSSKLISYACGNAGCTASPGFKPVFGHSGYDVNLVRHSDNTLPGTISLVTAQENQMLDEGSTQTKAPGMGRPGTEENPSRPINNKNK